MTIKTSKDDLFYISPFSKYGDQVGIDDFMEKDFTISARIKINKDRLIPQKDSFIISRNGRHSGLMTFLTENNQLEVRFTYWFYDEKNEYSIKSIVTILPTDFENEFNDYVITCNDTTKKMTFYLNNEKIGETDYNGLTKMSYLKTFLWLGCGNMLADDDFKCTGDFDFQYVYGLDRELTIEEVIDINENYKSSYLNYNNDFNLPILNNDIPYRDSFKFFSDSEYRNKYKIWNMVDNSIFFQYYLKNNTFY